MGLETADFDAFSSNWPFSNCQSLVGPVAGRTQHSKASSHVRGSNRHPFQTMLRCGESANAFWTLLRNDTAPDGMRSSRAIPMDHLDDTIDSAYCGAMNLRKIEANTALGFNAELSSGRHGHSGLSSKNANEVLRANG